MRKFGLIAAIVGVSILGAGLLLRMLANSGSWLWLPGFIALGVGGAVLLWSRWSPESPVIPAPKVSQMVGTDTARLLDNFEQRFAELKRRKAGGTVLGDLYALGAQLESRGRVVQATAVFRHLARIDNTYKDVSSRLKRLMDTDRTEPKAAPTPPRAPAPTPSASPAGATARDSSGMEGASRAAEGPEPQSLGRYKLEREIGRGAMGIVYLGRDTAINRSVAIKAIPLASEFTEAELVEARERFFREAETAGRLNHPNIVTIYDVGEDQGLAYIAMDFLQGDSLHKYSPSANLLPMGEVLAVVMKVAEGLDYAHKHHVVHRDIKPANIMYDRTSGRVKITDFGIAALTDMSKTKTGTILGSPLYMSPEQVQGHKVDGRSDLYSLGVTLYQLLRGELPFEAPSLTGLMFKIANDPPPDVTFLRPDIPPTIKVVVDKALQKDPDARFQTGMEMANALRLALGVRKRSV